MRESPTGRAASNGGADNPLAISTPRSPIIIDIVKLATKVWIIKIGGSRFLLCVRNFAIINNTSSRAHNTS